MPYLIAYDISSPRRLRRVARRLERSAVRVQLSVFEFRGEEAGVRALLDELTPMLDRRTDRLQAWRVTWGGGSRERSSSLKRGHHPAREPAALIVGGGGGVRAIGGER